MSDHTVVSLDIETTGLRPESDDILEIAAVKYEGAREVDCFHTLVKPHGPIPYYIQCLTGITAGEVENAPAFSEIAPRLFSFLGHLPLVGHNLAFDLGFLSAKGVPLTNPVYDTLELSSLLLPGLTSYGLVSVARHLECSSKVHHRALHDARTSHLVFLALLDKAAMLPHPVLAEMARLMLFAGWPLADVFRTIEREKGTLRGGERESNLESAFALISQSQEVDEPPRPRGSVKGVDCARLVSYFEPAGLLEKAWPNFERRNEQITMMQGVARAFNENRHLLVEAGTGIGKSLAYLLPALEFIRDKGEPVVVSTDTINLQEQLLHKDIPGLMSALGISPDDLRVSVLKGRANYLCLRRWENYRQANASLEDARFMLRSLVWLTGTTTGDKAELHIGADGKRTWSKVCSNEDVCLSAHCPYRRRGLCFLHRARQNAEKSHLTVVNHALLLSELATGGKILPEYRHLIVDEAHHLEEEATEQLGFEISRTDVTDFLDSLHELVSGQTYGGLLAEIRASIRKSSVAVSRKKDVEELVMDLQTRIQPSRQSDSDFFDVLASFMSAQTGGQGNYARQLRFTPAARHLPSWGMLRLAAENLDLKLADVISGLSKLFTQLDGLSSGVPDCETFLMRLNSAVEAGADLRSRLKNTILNPERGFISWGTYRPQDNTASLKAAPLEVGPLLNERLFRGKDTVVLTSATLSIECSFDFMKQQLGLEDAEELLIGSPFDYATSTLLYAVDDIPEPDRQGYQAALEASLTDICRAAEGRTMVLFTSHAALQGALSTMQPALEKGGILVLGQGVSGSNWQILETFKTHPRTVLLGTSSFWEGVDVVGPALSVLAITRLPFPVPSEPVNAARAELFESPFDEYFLSQAVLKFKQGFGRLIRSRTDRGVVVVLDSRLNSRYYGQVFLKSLPPCALKKGGRRLLGQSIKTWLGPVLSDGPRPPASGAPVSPPVASS